MRGIALDPVTGDIALSAGKARLTVAGAEAVGQRLKIRLGLWLGEYPLDQRIGIPYATTLGTKDTPSTPGGPRRLERILRRAAQTCPGVSVLRSFTMTVDANRAARVTLDALATDGQPVSLADFVVGTL